MNDINEAERIEPVLFGRLQRTVRTFLGDASRLAIGVVVADLRARDDSAGPLTGFTDPPSAIRPMVGSLAGDVSARIQLAQAEFDREISWRTAPSDSAAVARSNGFSPSLLKLSSRLARAIRRVDPTQYRRLRAGLHRVAPSSWSGENANPMAADVLAQSFIACVADILATPAQRSVLQPVLLGEVAESLAAIVPRINRQIERLARPDRDGRENSEGGFEIDYVESSDDFPQAVDTTEESAAEPFVTAPSSTVPPLKFTGSRRGATPRAPRRAIEDAVGRIAHRSSPPIDGSGVSDPTTIGNVSERKPVELISWTPSTRRLRPGRAIPESVVRRGRYESRKLDHESRDGSDRLGDDRRPDDETRQVAPASIVADIVRDAASLGVSAFGGTSAKSRRSVLRLKSVAGLQAAAVAFAHSLGVPPYSREARHRHFALIRVRLARLHAPAAQIALVDLISSLFDHAFENDKLPDAAKPLVWRLQQPALVLVLLDEGYLVDSHRSIPHLIESIGLLVCGGGGFSQGSETQRHLETTVRAIEIVSSALHARSRILAIQIDREYDRCAHSIAQVTDRIDRELAARQARPTQQNRRDDSRRPGRDQERAVTARLDALLAGQFVGRVVPRSVNGFLRDVWLRVLRSALLRAGEEGASFKQALQTVADLLASLDGHEIDGRNDLASRIPNLIERLTHGMRTVGAKEVDHQGFFDELFLTHLGRLQQRGRPEQDRPTRRRISQTGEMSNCNDQNTGVDNGHATQPAIPSRPEPPGRVAGLDERALPFDTTGHPSSNLSAAVTIRGARFLKRYQNVPILDQMFSADDPIVPPSSGLKDAPATDAERSAERASRNRPRQSQDVDSGARTENRQTRAMPLRGQRLLDVLGSTTLDDLPVDAGHWPVGDVAPVDDLEAGDWLVYQHRSGIPMNLKLAWANERRTVALLVRSPDRRAVSRSFADLRQLVGAKRLLVVRRAREGPLD